jgi:hypothetical protein
MAFSPSLLKSSDPGATLARASLNSGDRPQPFTPPRSDPLRPILIARLRSRDTASRTRALHTWLACQLPSPLALGPFGQCALPLCR